VLVFIRLEISRHLRGAEGAEPLSVAKGLVYYVPGAVVWKGRRIAATDLLLSIYSVVASRRVIGDAELNLPSEPNSTKQTHTPQGGGPHRD
jgi:cytochrome P450